MTQSAGDARKTTQQRPKQREPEPKDEAHQPGGGEVDHACNVAFCPIGLALTAAERVQPDVVAHLLVAGREFFLAAKAVMDARADDLRDDGPSEGPARMERIDIG